MYECVKCNKTFIKKGDYTRHINRKTPCIKIELYICEHCDYKTNRKYNFIKHKNRKTTCNSEQNIEESHKIEEIKKPFEFQDELKKLYDKYKISINNGTINNINNNINNINLITINPFGKEDLSHIDNTKAKKILNNGLLAVSKYIEYVHQDSDVPQNHNLYISGWNSRSNVNMFNGKKWIIADKDDVIPQVIDNCMDFINDKIEELDETNPEDEKILRMANRLKTAYDNNDVGKLKCVAKEIQKTLYNNRDIIKDTLKKHKQIDNK